MIERKPRFAEADEEQLYADYDADDDSAREEENSEDVSIIPKTQENRDRIWSAWIEYILSIPFQDFLVYC